MSQILTRQQIYLSFCTKTLACPKRILVKASVCCVFISCIYPIVLISCVYLIFYGCESSIMLMNDSCAGLSVMFFKILSSHFWEHSIGQYVFVGNINKSFAS